MRIKGKHFRSIWKEGNYIKIIDQRCLPYELKIVELDSLEEFSYAIKEMQVRGAPLIGVTAAYGIAKSIDKDPSDENLLKTCEILAKTRPTAINLFWAINLLKKELLNTNIDERSNKAIGLADSIADDDISNNEMIGINGAKILKEYAGNQNKSIINILTHCNAGWLATVDKGTALSPIFKARDEGLNIHVWVDETRPRNQGCLTAWELENEEIEHTVIVDNAGGHLMQTGLIDIVIVGSDRTSLNGDVCNKIGTYLKALSAKDNNIPFYAALPISTIDREIENGLEIPIENRSNLEVKNVRGLDANQNITEINLYPNENTKLLNPAFDVTPAKLVTGIITDKGVCLPQKKEIIKLLNNGEKIELE
tara:strand:- start:12713 stop:13810 length:1098 start_codon:yes stop_codon:yes gene_type:complete